MHLSNSTFLNRGFAAVFCPKCQCIFMAANTFCKLINRFKHVVRHLAAVHTIICGSVLNISWKIFWVFVFQSFEEEEKKEKKRVSQGNKESMIVLGFFCPLLLYNSYQKGREQTTKMCLQPLLVSFLFRESIFYMYNYSRLILQGWYWFPTLTMCKVDFYHLLPPFLVLMVFIFASSLFGLLVMMCAQMSVLQM